MRAETDVSVNCGHVWRRTVLLFLLTVVLADFDRDAPTVVRVLRVGLTVAALGILTATPAWHRSRGFWLAVCGLLAVPIALDPLGQANHAYVQAYVACVFLLAAPQTPTERDRIVRWNFRWLLVLAMGLAGVQKIASDEYRAYTAAQVESGRLLSPLRSVLPPDPAYHHNVAVVAALARHNPHRRPSSIRLQDTVLAPVARKLGVLAIAYELVLAGLFAIAPTTRSVHLLTLAFVLGTLVVVQEAGFLSLICVLAGACVPSRDRRITSAYAFVAGGMLGLVYVGLAMP